MAKVAGRGAKVLYGIADLSNWFNSADVAREGSALEVSGLGDTARMFIPGLRGGTVSLSGFYDGDQDATDEKLSNSLATADGEVVTVMPEGLTVGKVAECLKARTTRYGLSSPVDGVGTVSGDIQSDGGVRSGHVLRTLDNEVTSDGDETSVDNAASTAEGGVGHLHVTEADNDGGGDLVVMIEHSDTGAFAGEQAVLVTFAPVEGQPVAERVEVAAGTTVNRHLREVHLVSGGVAPRWTFAVAFGRGR